MSLSKRSVIIFPIVMLSVLAILTAWINHMVQPPQAKPDGSSRHDPDYIVSNFVNSQTDAKGNLRYKLAAAQMKHFADDDSTALQHPLYTQYAVGKPYTQVQALRGYVASDGEQVELFDKVKITRQAFAGKGEMTVETEYLNILPNQDLVKTDKPVVIKQTPKTVIYATGMVYEKNTGTVTLLNRVRAHYEKPTTIRPNVAATKQSKQLQSKTQPSKKEAKKNTKPTEAASQKADSRLPKSKTNNERIRRTYD